MVCTEEGMYVMSEEEKILQIGRLALQYSARKGELNTLEEKLLQGSDQPDFISIQEACHTLTDEVAILARRLRSICPHLV
jgi:hypothetical protein